MHFQATFCFYFSFHFMLCGLVIECSSKTMVMLCISLKRNSLIRRLLINLLYMLPLYFRISEYQMSFNIHTFSFPLHSQSSFSSAFLLRLCCGFDNCSLSDANIFRDSENITSQWNTEFMVLH